MVENERKTENIHVMMEPSLKQHLVREAARKEQPVSSYIRALLIWHSGYREAMDLQAHRRRMIDKALED